MPKRMVFYYFYYKAFFKVFSWRLTERAYFRLWRVQKLKAFRVASRSNIVIRYGFRPTASRFVIAGKNISTTVDIGIFIIQIARARRAPIARNRVRPIALRR